MKTFGIITNRDKDEKFIYTKRLISSIQNRGGKVKVPSDTARKLKMHDEGLDEQGVIDGSDIIVCLGGDGTFLRVARKVYLRNIPMLGINLGSLGFLTEVDRNEIDIAVDCLISGDFKIEERMMLEAVIKSKGRVIGQDIALNDVVVARGAVSRILNIRTYINDTFVDNFPGDGLIVSSPTGSTGYTLSAGGPIVEPDVELIIVTPICPHILYSRSFVATGDRVVRAVIDESYMHKAIVSVDGEKGYEIKAGDVIEIRKSPHTVKFIKINERNHYHILRTKIYFRGENLRKNEI